MYDDPKKKQQGAEQIQAELKRNSLSRRGLLRSLQALGFGFGAAHLLGVKDAGAVPNGSANDTSVSLRSTNPALDDIIEEGRQVAPANSGEDEGDLEGLMKVAYRRHYVRNYFRGGYHRFYNRFGGARRRYTRIYRRFV